MVVIICGKYGNNRSRTENVTEQTWFSKSRSNDLQDIGQGQRSSHATHPLMLVIICTKYGIICTKYGKNPSRSVHATERTRFSRSRLIDLESIGQGQRSTYDTPSDANDDLCQIWKECKQNCRFFFQSESQKTRKILKFYNFVINLTRDTPSNGSDYLWQIWK